VAVHKPAPRPQRPRPEARIFVPPPAPDDPGTASEDEQLLVQNLRGSAAKA